MPYSDQKKGMLLAFTAIMFITPDALFIRMANLASWNLIFYRGFIPFFIVFVGLLIIYKAKFFSQLIEMVGMASRMQSSLQSQISFS